ncbi:MAG: hypothetical protein KatS3mg044_0738 [Rhodothermaceae bacterium]|nr:MAG: hypothetical protein KatS3mg044_0738 [Rhodothermaceae bacterium]
MTPSMLDQEIQAALKDLATRIQRLQDTHSVPDREATYRRMLHEITHLYGAVALCRARIERYLTLAHDEPGAPRPSARTTPLHRISACA